MTEFEKKMLLSKEEYDYLMEHMGHDSHLSPKLVSKQINFYFDTDDLSMNRENTTCRIRFMDGNYKGTMKSHSESGERSIETEMEVRDGIRDNAFTDMGLRLQGELTTQRCIILKDEHYEVVLDKNEYLGISDYELEIEYMPEFEKEAQTIYQVILDMLFRRKCLLAYKEIYKKKPNVPSKSNRFFERMTVNNSNEPKRATHMDIEECPCPDKIVSISSLEDSYEDADTCTYSDPDDYMHGYYGSIIEE